MMGKRHIIQQTKKKKKLFLFVFCYLTDMRISGYVIITQRQNIMKEWLNIPDKYHTSDNGTPILQILARVRMIEFFFMQLINCCISYAYACFIHKSEYPLWLSSSCKCTFIMMTLLVALNLMVNIYFIIIMPSSIVIQFR